MLKCSKFAQKQAFFTYLGQKMAASYIKNGICVEDYARIMTPDGKPEETAIPGMKDHLLLPGILCSYMKQMKIPRLISRSVPRNSSRRS